MSTREDAIASLRKKAEKEMIAEIGPVGGPENPAPHISPKKKPKKKAGPKAEISNPIYDDMHKQDAKERHDMKMADAAKEKMHQKKKAAASRAMKAGR